MDTKKFKTCKSTGCPTKKQKYIFLLWTLYIIPWTRSKVVQKGLKGTMVNPIVFEHLGAFMAQLDPFGPFQNSEFFAPNGKSRVWRRCFGAKKQFLFEMVHRVHMGPKCSKMVKNTWVDHFGSFWTLLDNFGTCPKYQKRVQSRKKLLLRFFLGHPVQNKAWTTVAAQSQSDPMIAPSITIARHMASLTPSRFSIFRKRYCRRETSFITRNKKGIHSSVKIALGAVVEYSSCLSCPLAK